MATETPRAISARAAVPLALALLLAPAGEAAAQALDVMRSTGRAVERAITSQVERALRPQLSVRGLYDAPPRALALSGDGARLAVVTGDGGLRVHDLSAGAEVLDRAPRAGGITAVALEPAGTGIAALGADGAVRYAAGAARLPRVGIALPGAPGTAVAFAGGGLAIGHRDGAVTVIAPASRDVLARAPATGSPVTAIAAAGRAAVIGHADGALRVLSDGGVTALAPAGGAVTGLASADGLRVVAGSGDGRARVIDPGSGATLADWRAHGPGPVSVAAAAGRIVTGSRDGGAVLWDEAGNRRAALLDAREGPVTAVAAARPREGLRALAAGPGTGVAVTDPGGRRLVTLYPTRRGWGAVDARGRFDGDESAFDDLAWSAESLRLPVERYAQGYFEPGLVYKHLLGDDRFLTEAGAVVTEGLPRPPEAAIEIAEAPGGPGGTIRVEVRATAADPLAVAGIRLFQNGKRVGRDAVTADETGEARGRRTRTMRFALPALAGENRLTAIARDGAGIDSAPAEATVAAGRATPTGRMHLTAVGIDRYANSRLNLNYAVADARGVAALLPERGAPLFGGVERDLVLNADATREGIVAALDRLERTAPDDAAVLFLAGHAVTIAEGWHFLGHGLTDPQRPGEVQAVGLSGDALVEALTEVPARRLLLVIDACHAGAVLGPFERFSQRRALLNLQQQTGVVVIAATRADQEAPEFPRLGHGLMTYVLLQGLSPGEDGRLQADTAPRDGRITANELRLFVEETVPTVAAFLENSLGRGAPGGLAAGVTPVGLALGANFDLAR